MDTDRDIYIYIYIYILGSHMAPYGACEVAQSTARSNAQFEAERFRKEFRRKNKHLYVGKSEIELNLK